MTRSAYTVFSALVVVCDKASGGCGAAIGKRCTSKSGLEMAHCHPSRRKAADAQRTREVNPELASHSMTAKEAIRIGEAFAQGVRDGIASVIPSSSAPTYCRFCFRAEGYCICADPPDFLPMREPLPSRAPDLNADDTHSGPRDE